MTRRPSSYLLWLTLAVFFGVLPAACAGADTTDGDVEDAAADATDTMTAS
jgi:hypothetical protein